MHLFWLVFSDGDHIQVLIQPASTLIHARVHAGLAGMDNNHFIEGHELDAKTERRVPKTMIGRRLSQREAKKLLVSFGG